jgi:hypothetical protein
LLFRFLTLKAQMGMLILVSQVMTHGNRKTVVRYDG